MPRKLGAHGAVTEERAREFLDSILSDLKAKKAGIRCTEMRDHLTDLGFTLTSGKCEGHKIVTHASLASFTSASYDCGHSKNGFIKPPYVVKIIRAITDLYEDLVSFLKDQS